MFSFAISGCGKIAEKHAQEILRTGRLLAVCDADFNKAQAFESIYHAKAYSSLDELLKNEHEIDIISICSPNGMHAEQVIKSLQAGKYVLCEKPLCLTPAGAWQIIETEKYSGKKLFVVKSARYNPFLKEVKRMLDIGLLGKIYSFQMNCFWNRPASYFNDWRGTVFPDGGTLYTQFSHYIDALLWLFGAIEKVSGFRTNSAHQNSIEFEDTGSASLLMENKVIGGLSWTVNTHNNNFEIGLTIIAEHATIKLGGTYMDQLEYVSAVGSINNLLSGINLADKTTTKQTGHHKEIYDQMVHSILTGDFSYTGAFEGLRTVEAIDKIYNSVPLIPQG